MKTGKQALTGNTVASELPFGNRLWCFLKTSLFVCIGVH
jgi:hypothetical protein